MLKLQLKTFVFYTFLTWVFWELAKSLKNIALGLYFGGENLSSALYELTYVKNTGGAFSILHTQTNFLIFFAIIALICIFYYVFKCVKITDRWSILTFSLLSAGVLGNLIERIQTGYVLDFIKLNFINFPIFNFFDIYITFAVIIVFIETIMDKKRKTVK